MRQRLKHDVRHTWKLASSTRFRSSRHQTRQQLVAALLDRGPPLPRCDDFCWKGHKHAFAAVFPPAASLIAGQWRHFDFQIQLTVNVRHHRFKARKSPAARSLRAAGAPVPTDPACLPRSAAAALRDDVVRRSRLLVCHRPACPFGTAAFQSSICLMFFPRDLPRQSPLHIGPDRCVTVPFQRDLTFSSCVRAQMSAAPSQYRKNLRTPCRPRFAARGPDPEGDHTDRLREVRIRCRPCQKPVQFVAARNTRGPSHGLCRYRTRAYGRPCTAASTAGDAGCPFFSSRT